MRRASWLAASSVNVIAGDFAGFVAVREHHGNPTRHQRGLARARSGLNQQHRRKIGHGSPTVVLIHEGHVDAFQSLLSV
jgi:hypothetical protein